MTFIKTPLLCNKEDVSINMAVNTSSPDFVWTCLSDELSLTDTKQFNFGINKIHTKSSLYNVSKPLKRVLTMLHCIRYCWFSELHDPSLIVRKWTNAAGIWISLFCWTKQNAYSYLITPAEPASEVYCIRFRTLNVGSSPEKQQCWISKPIL